MSKKISIWLALIVLLSLTAGCGRAGNSTLKYRWVYICYSLTENANVPIVQKIMTRAKAAGYNGIWLSEYHLQEIDLMDKSYLQNMEQIKKTARDLGLELYPEICTFGCAWPLLAHNPNLAEGCPIKDAVFQAKNGVANLVPDSTKLVNGGFDQLQGSNFAGWDKLQAQGPNTFADTVTAHSGTQSLRIEGRCQLLQEIKVTPYHLYHVSLWIKTLDAGRRPGVDIEVDAPTGWNIAYPFSEPTSTQDWTKYEFDFNSYDNSRVKFNLSTGRGNGKIWIDDLNLEEVGLVNLLRRDGCPLAVKGTDGTVYKEGQDFQPVSDPLLGYSQHAPVGNKISTFGLPLKSGSTGWYDVYHTPPAIHLTPNSRIKEGQKLLVSYYSDFPTTHHEEINACFSHPETYKLVDKQISTTKALLENPHGYIMGHDEIRNAGWCELCQARKMTAGELLADNFKKCADIVHKNDSNAAVFTWNDMFDPNMNAAKDPWHNGSNHYYLVNGNYWESWKGLSKDVIVLNWNQNNDKSLKFFADLGNSQMLIGYYDDDPGKITGWLKQAQDMNAPVVGVVYCTWAKEYKDLEAFAKAAWGSPANN